jgi:hypothetical protein
MERINSYISQGIFSEFKKEGFKSANLANNTMSTVHVLTKLGQRKQFLLNVNTSNKDII